MTVIHTCSQCGAPLREGQAGARCATCLLGLAFRVEAVPKATPVHVLLRERHPPAVVRLHFLGDYDLIEEVGRGGMGVVFRATQTSLRREVALKLVQAGPIASSAAVKRFRTEAEATAALDHPHIVSVYEVGAHEGLHYLSMKFIEGGTLAHLLHGSAHSRNTDNAPPCSVWPELSEDLSARIGLFGKVCDAVRHAHERGILHRDLKPANILLDSAGNPYVSDFGLARLDDGEVGLTLSGQVFGTPAYLAPELVTHGGAVATPASEVWSLGVILYELLSGRLPFEGGSRAEILRRILQVDPVAPSRHGASAWKWGPVSLRGHGESGREAATYSWGIPRASDRAALDAICLKCLEKEPSNRYASVQELAEDIGRWRSGDAVRAPRIGLRVRIQRWLKRHPGIALLSAAALLVIGGVLAVAWRQWVQAEDARQGERSAREVVLRQRLLKAEDLLARQDFAEAFATLAAVIREAPTQTHAVERLLFGFGMREMGFVPLFSMNHGEVECLTVRISYDQKFIATLDSGRRIHLWDASDGRARMKPLQLESDVFTLDFDWHHRRLVVCTQAGELHLIDPVSGVPVCPVVRGPGPLRRSLYTPDGRGIHLVWGDRLDTVELASGRTLNSRAEKGPIEEFFYQDSRLLVGARQGTNYVYREAGNETPVKSLSVGEISSNVPTVPGGKSAVSRGISDRELWNWDLASGEKHVGYRSSNAPIVVHTLSSSEPQVLAVQTGSNQFQVLDARTGEPRGIPFNTDGLATHMGFRRNDACLIFMEGMHKVRLVDHRMGRDILPPLRTTYPILDVYADPAVRLVVTAGRDGFARAYQVLPSELPSVAFGLTNSWIARFSPKGDRVGISGRRPTSDGKSSPERVWLLDGVSGGSLAGLVQEDDASWLSFSPDGSMVATASNDGMARVWRSDTGEPVTHPLKHPDEVWQVDFSPDGSQIVTACYDGKARVWDIATGEMVAPVLPHGAGVHYASFSPDGTRILTAMIHGSPESPGGAFLWDSRTHQPIGRKMVHSGTVRRAKFSPDGRRVATASFDDTARIWDAETGQPLSPLLSHGANVFQAEFSLDGTRLLTVSQDGTAQIWNGTNGARLGPAMRLGAVGSSAGWDRSGRRLVAGIDTGAIRVWSAENAQPLSGLIPCGNGIVRSVEFSPDDQRVLVGTMGSGSRWIEVPVATEPAPGWLAPFAEAVVGLRMERDERFQEIPELERWSMIERIRNSKDRDEFTRWAQWLLGCGDSNAPRGRP